MCELFLINAADTGGKKHPLDCQPEMQLENIKALVGGKCRLIDTRFEQIDFKEVKNSIIIVSFWSTAVKYAMDVCKKIKENDPGNIIVAVAPYASFFPENIMYKSSPIDHILAGETELIVPEFIKELKKEKPDLNKFSNLINKRKKRHSIRVEENLDKLKIPSLSYRYFSVYPIRGVLKVKHGFILSSRGCKHNCRFCSPICIRRSFGKTFRSHSTEYTLRAIKKSLDDGCNVIYFMDDDFVQSRARVVELCNNIVKKGIRFKWIAQARIDELDKELLVLMKKAGCVMLKVGIESGSEKVLRNLNKTNDPKKWLENARIIFKFAKKINLDLMTMFILGTPNETKKDLEATKKLIKEIKPFIIELANYTDYPGYRGNLEYSTVLDLPHHREYKKALKKQEMKIYRDFYFNPAFLLKQIKYMPFYVFNAGLFLRLVRYLI